MTAGVIAPTTHSVRTPLRWHSSLRRQLVPGALPERRVHRPARLVEPLGIQRLQVVFVPFEGGQPSGAAEDFLTGFIADTERGEAYGRPVGLALLPDGLLLVADDAGNPVWRVETVE
jgi:hypothetical protein